MNILEEIRKEKITTNWFIHEDNWYKFDNGDLYSQDKSKTGSESIFKILDEEKYKTILSAYKIK